MMPQLQGLTPRYPLLRPPIRRGENNVIHLWLGGQWQTLSGKDAAAVVDVLERVDGFATQEDITTSLVETGRVSEDWLASLFRLLKEMAICIEDREDRGDQPLREHYLMQLRHVSEYTSYPTTYQQMLQTSRVTVIGLDYLGTLLVERLAEAGVGQLRAIGKPMMPGIEAASAHTNPHMRLAERIQARGYQVIYDGLSVEPDISLDWKTVLADTHLAVLVLPQRLPDLLRAFNQACLEQDIPFLPIWIEDEGAQVGPMVIPQETSCLACYEFWHRERISHEDIGLLQPCPEVVMPDWTDSALLIPWAVAIAAIATCEIVTTLAPYRQPPSYGQALFIPTHSWQIQPTTVFKMPRCPACSRATQMPLLQPFALSP